jgi:hypothetical protein
MRSKIPVALLTLLSACAPGVEISSLAGAAASSGGGPDAGPPYCGAPAGVPLVPALWGMEMPAPFDVASFRGLAIDPTGSILAIGVINGAVDLGSWKIGAPNHTIGFVAGFTAGGEISPASTVIVPTDIVLDDQGYPYLTGFPPGSGPTVDRIVLEQYEVVYAFPSFWTVGTWSAPIIQTPPLIRVTPDQNLVFAGATAQSAELDAGALHLSITGPDLWLLEVSTMNQPVWATSVGAAFASMLPDAFNPFVVDIAVDPAGNIVVAGTNQHGPGQPPGNDMFLARFGPDGVPLWSQRVDIAGLTSYASAGKLAVDASGRIALSGGFFPDGTAPPPSPGDWTFLALYDASGSLLGAQTFAQLCLAPEVVGFRPDGLLSVLGVGAPDAVYAGTLDPLTRALTYTSGHALSVQSCRGYLAPSGNLVVTGVIDGPSDLGMGPAKPKVNSPSFVATLPP